MTASSKPAVSPARAAAFDILLKVHEQRAFAVELLHSSRLDDLSAADRALCTELVMGVLRWQSRLDAEIEESSSQRLSKLDPEILIALRLGAYQLEFLERVPKRAAVNESVELVKRARKRSAAAFVNAVLRKRAAGVSVVTVNDPSLARARSLAHPLWLLERWTSRYGAERARVICAFDQQVPRTAIRLADPEAEEELKKSGVELAPGALLRDARQVVKGDVSRTNACRERRVVIQDEGSQLVAALVGPGTRLLDCCAAPGGKTSYLAAKNPSSQVVAAELHPHRAWLARKLVPAENVHVVAADAKALPFRGGFDRVLADVPCSGTGTLARNPEIKWNLQPGDLASLHVRQVAILSAALDQLAPGGRLVYSTCSLEPEENLHVVAEVLTERPEASLLDCRELLGELQRAGELVWQDIDTLTEGRFLRTLPGVQPCDGFFAAVIRKQ